MKKTFFISVLLVSCLSVFSQKKDKLWYPDTIYKFGDLTIRTREFLATKNYAKGKVIFENKNDFFILVDASKCFFYANGNKFYYNTGGVKRFSRDHEVGIVPNSKRDKVFDSKWDDLQPDAVSLVLDGLSKTTNEKIVDYTALKVPDFKKEISKGIEITLADINYEKEQVTIKLKIKNSENDLLIVNPGVIELEENGTSLNNVRPRVKPILLKKGDDETIALAYKTIDKKSNKTISWNDGLQTAVLAPMNPIEIPVGVSPQAVAAFKTFLPPAPVVINNPKDKTEVVVKEKENITKADPKKAEKKEPKNPKSAKPEENKTVAANTAVKKNEPKRSAMEDDMEELHAANVNFDNTGAKFYGLLIGVSDYTDPGISDLDNLPVNDALALEKVLTTNYTFDPQNVKVLKNPTRREIVIAMDELAKKVTAEDNVLIFYAGHGHYEDENDIGYWLPKDAEVSNSSNWLYNDQLVASMRKIKSLHTLLISDACFSGSIFKNRSVSMGDASAVIKKKYQLPSRKALTSGTLKTVPNKSVFIKYLIDRLEKNKEKYYASSSLYQAIEQPVGNNSNSLPQFGVIQNVGDEGGDFIFIRR